MKGGIFIKNSDIQLLNAALAGAKVLEVDADEKGEPRVLIETQDGAGVALHGGDLHWLLKKLKRDRQQVKTATKILSTVEKFFGKSYDTYSHAFSDILELLTIADEKISFIPTLTQKNNSRIVS